MSDEDTDEFEPIDDEQEEHTAADIIQMQDVALVGAPTIVRHGFVIMLALKDRASDSSMSMSKYERCAYNAALSQLTRYLNGVKMVADEE